MTTGTGPGSAALDPILATTVIETIANMSIAGTAQDPSIDLPVAAPHIIEAPGHIATAETLPTPDLLTATPPGMTADPGITPNITNTNWPEVHHQQHEHHLETTKTRDRNIKKL